jgi:hypothetical protein
MKPNREVCRQCQEKFLSEFFTQNSNKKWDEGFIVCPVLKDLGAQFFVEVSGEQLVGYVGCIAISLFEEMLFKHCLFATEHTISTEKQI